MTKNAMEKERFVFYSKYLSNAFRSSYGIRLWPILWNGSFRIDYTVCLRFYLLWLMLLLLMFLRTCPWPLS